MFIRYRSLDFFVFESSIWDIFFEKCDNLGPDRMNRSSPKTAKTKSSKIPRAKKGKKKRHELFDLGLAVLTVFLRSAGTLFAIGFVSFLHLSRKLVARVTSKTGQNKKVKIYTPRILDPECS